MSEDKVKIGEETKVKLQENNEEISFEGETISNLLNLVLDLNQHIYSCTGEKGLSLTPLELITNGYFAEINFMDQVIWSSDDNERLLDDEDELNLEPLKDYLIREIKNILINLSDIVF